MYDNQAEEFRDRNPYRVAEEVEPVLADEPDLVEHVGGGAPLQLRRAVAGGSPAIEVVAYNATLDTLARLERRSTVYAEPDAGAFAR